MFKKSLCSILAMLLSIVILPIKAETNNDILTDEKLLALTENVKVIATATNTKTGESLPVEITPLVPDIMPYSDSNAITVGYEIFVPVEDGSSIMPLDSGSSSQERSGATATMTVTFYLRNEQIQVVGFSGGWSGSSDLYYFTGRNVGVTSGALGNRVDKYPTSNTFSYTTGWGYTTYVLGDVGPYAWSDATGWISGMEQGGGINLALQFQFVNHFG